MTFPCFRSWQALAALIVLCSGLPAGAQQSAKLDPPVKPVVTGKFTGNGKDAGIRFVRALEREAFNGKEAIMLIFSEKDASGAKKPDFDAMFGRLGNALTISVFHDGGIFGCEVSHSAHEKRGFSSLGQIEMRDFKLTGGNVSGRLTTGKELDTFGNKWEVDLTFAAPLPESLRSPTAAIPKPVAKEANRETPMEKPKAAAGPLIPARNLPLPKGATDIQFKALVKHIQFSVPRPVEAVAKEFSANLQQQGWKDGGGSLLGKQNAILKREQGAAKLTIMVQPAPGGSVVKIFTEGLDWTGAEQASTPGSKKPASVPSVSDIEAEAQKALNEALKGLPKGL